VLSQTVEEHVRAVFTGLWIRSHEHDDAFNELARMCDSRERKDWTILRWDIAHRLRGPGAILRLPVIKRREPPLPVTPGGQLPPRANPDNPAEKAYSAPADLLEDLPEIARQVKAAFDNVDALILVMDNFHRLLSTNMGPVYIQQIQELIRIGKSGIEVAGCSSPIRFFLVILSPAADIPIELLRQFAVVDHALPGAEQLWEIVEGVASPEELPVSEEDRAMVLEAATGLTRMEAENAVALSLIRTADPETKLGRVDPGEIWNSKAQCLKKSGLLELYTGTASFDDMGGIAEFRDFATRLLASVTRSRGNPLLLPKGLLLLGVPGSGKSQAAKCLATASGRRLLQMDIGSLMSKYVGDSDKNMREALDIAGAMAPCILFID